jgi:hypothetical protein
MLDRQRPLRLRGPAPPRLRDHRQCLRRHRNATRRSRTGDTLIVLAEQVVAVAMTWPFAVTADLRQTPRPVAAAPKPARASPILRVRAPRHRRCRLPSTPPTLAQAVWDFRSTRSLCRCSPDMPAKDDVSMLASERQRRLHLGRFTGRRDHSIGDDAGEFQCGILAQAGARGSNADARPARGVEDRVCDRRHFDSFHANKRTYRELKGKGMSQIVRAATAMAG